MGAYTRPALAIAFAFIIGMMLLPVQYALYLYFLSMAFPHTISLEYLLNPMFPDTLLVAVKLVMAVILLLIAFAFSYFITVLIITGFARRAMKNVKPGIYKTNNVFFDTRYSEYMKANIYVEVLDRMIMIFPYLRVYILRKLGAKIGKNVTLGGIIREPHLVEIGDGAVIGYKALISGHAQNRGEFVLGPVKIGKNAIIGAGAIIFPFVEVGEAAVVGANGVVPSNTKIPPNTLYAGVPAREIKKYPPQNVGGAPEIKDAETWIREKMQQTKK